MQVGENFSPLKITLITQEKPTMSAMINKVSYKNLLQMTESHIIPHSIAPHQNFQYAPPGKYVPLISLEPLHTPPPLRNLPLLTTPFFKKSPPPPQLTTLSFKKFAPIDHTLLQEICTNDHTLF